MKTQKIYEEVIKRLKEYSENVEELEEDIEECGEGDSLEEFSGVAAIGGGPATPLGTDAYGNVGSPSKWLKKNRTH